MPQRLDAVLPLTAADVERAQILFRSLERFFEPLGTCFVVAPDADAEAVGAAVPRGRYRLVRETALVPELADAAAPHGWFVQQLVKLAAAESVASPFYLTLDADVICVRRTRYEDLVRDGRALAEITRPHHPEWNDDAERILGLPRAERQYGVTPALLSRDGVLALQRHLGGDWRARLLRELPWTEYALYNTFLEGAGLWDAYHRNGGERALAGNSVWIGAQWPGWQPKADGRYFFSVVQSATRVPAHAVAERVEPFLRRGAAVRAA